MFFPTPFLEYRSFAALARHVLNDDRTWPTPQEIREMANISGMTPVQVSHKLKQVETWSSETYLKIKLTPPTHRAHEKSVRGFRRGSHDRDTVAPHFNPTRTEGECLGLAEAYSTDEAQYDLQLDEGTARGPNGKQYPQIDNPNWGFSPKAK